MLILNSFNCFKKITPIIYFNTDYNIIIDNIRCHFPLF